MSAPPPPPKPFKLAAGVWRTDSTAPGASECYFARKDATGKVIMEFNSDHGAWYVATIDADSEFVTSGCLPWHAYTDTQQVGSPARFIWTGQPGQIYHARESYADGDYIAGHNFPTETGDVAGPQTGELGKNPNFPGTNPGECHWQRLWNWTGSPGTVLASGDGGQGDGSTNGPGWITWHQGDGIRLVDCNGMCTPG